MFRVQFRALTFRGPGFGPRCDTGSSLTAFLKSGPNRGYSAFTASTLIRQEGDEQ
ncbi:hypothetical protein MGN70_004007 [Eutypa lata]|nr:hypothetical protein MGN70_004007 [Eutypa lata]